MRWWYASPKKLSHPCFGRIWLFIALGLGMICTTKGTELWRPDQPKNTKSGDTYPFTSRACPKNSCDLAPIFKLLEATPTGTAYNLIGVLYPANTVEYQRLLKHSERQRRCNGCSRFFHSKCSFFQEFVIFVGGIEPLKIISWNDPEYNNIYLRLRHVEMDFIYEDKEDETEDSITFEIITCSLSLGLIISFIIVCCIVYRPKKHPTSPTLAPTKPTFRHKRMRQHIMKPCTSIAGGNKKISSKKRVTFAPSHLRVSQLNSTNEVTKKRQGSDSSLHSYSD